MAWIGDGATSTGAFHEGMNFAAVQKLALVVIAEDNKYAYSTPISKQMAINRIAERAAAYGIPHEMVDGNDMLAVYDVARRLVDRARAGEGASLIGVDTMRMQGHAQHDDARYVPKGMLDDWAAKDPLQRFTTRLARARGRASEREINEIDRMAKSYAAAEADLAVDEPAPDPSSVTRGVYAGDDYRHPEGRAGQITVRRPESRHAKLNRWLSSPISRRSVRRSSKRWRATSGLRHRRRRRRLRRRVQGHRRAASRSSARQRVIDTPISEAAIVGSAIGASYMGMRPVCEIQFIDFIACCFDMLTNFAATSRYRNGAGVPIVVRGPAAGGVGGGPFHSLNPESFFLNTPGLKMVEPSTAYDAKGLLKAAIRDDDPVLYFEHKYLYRRIKDEVPDEDYVVPIGKATVRREGRDLSIITFGAMVHTALDAARQLEADGVQAEVLDLRSLAPLDREAVLTIGLEDQSRAAVVRGSPHRRNRRRAGGDYCRGRIRVPRRSYRPRRLGRRPVPYAPPLEAAFLPGRREVGGAGEELGGLLIRFTTWPTTS